MLKRSGMRVGTCRQAYTHAGRRTCKTSAGTHEPRAADRSDAKTEADARARGKMQDFTHLPLFSARPTWPTNLELLGKLLDVAVLLGLRHPSEPTFGMLFCILYRQSRIWSRHCSHLLTALQQIKGHARSHLLRTRVADLPPCAVHHLPHRFEDLCADVRPAAYGSGSPGQQLVPDAAAGAAGESTR